VTVQRLRDVPGFSIDRVAGPIADRHVRVAFSTEPVARLATLGDRVRRAVAAARTAP
jgi:hypothetical protein